MAEANVRRVYKLDAEENIELRGRVNLKVLIEGNGSDEDIEVIGTPTLEFTTAISQQAIGYSGWTPKMKPLVSNTWLSPRIHGAKLLGIVSGMKFKVKDKAAVREVEEDVYVFDQLPLNVNIMPGMWMMGSLRLKMKFWTGDNSLEFF